ncbi:MAG: acetamidase/formamidase family protein [Bryobacteraceae bacterium]|nr:acetamidase/formamidase family protein [Bryobacteraceae bacterium]MDW8378832.1 acetamidase/formamidase family protein [Bryobacterales bacterium]
MQASVLVFLIGTTLWGETHRVEATRFYHSFDHRHPVLARLKSGDRVETRTLDAGGYDHLGQKRAERGNPLTGPFYLEGAEPGDSIAVRIDRLRMNRDYGYTSFRLGLFSLAPESIEGLYPRAYRRGAVVADRDDIVKWRIDLAKNTVRLLEPVSKVHPLEFAARPMLGCIGVAAPGVFGPTSGISGSYGGNLDYNEIVEGTTVLLPVYHPGALLFVGDGHALQADGEPTGTGVETSMDLAMTITLRKKEPLENPRVETPTHIISIGSQPEFVSSLDRSIRIATSDMVNWLTRDYGMETWAAHLLIGYQGRYDVVTVAGSMALRLPRTALPKK